MTLRRSGRFTGTVKEREPSSIQAKETTVALRGVEMQKRDGSTGRAREEWWQGQGRVYEHSRRAKALAQLRGGQ